MTTKSLSIKHLWLCCALMALPCWVQAQTQPASGEEASLGFFQGMFQPKLRKLSELVDQGKLQEADEFLAAERLYFASVQNTPEGSALLKRLAQSYNNQFAPRFDAELAALDQVTAANPQNWAQERMAFQRARALVGEYLDRTIFSNQRLRSAKFYTLETRISGATQRVYREADAAFRRFDHTGPANFFSEYAAELPRWYLTDNSEALSEVLGKLSSEQVILFRAKYKEQLNFPKLDDLISARYAAATTAGTSGQARSPQDVVRVVKEAQRAGMSLTGVSSTKIAFVEIAPAKGSPLDGPIEFPAKVNMDMPLDAPLSTAVDALVETAARVDANLVVFVDVVASNVSRRVANKTDMDSYFVAGRHLEPNPDYQTILGRLLELRNELDNLRLDPNGNRTANLVTSVLIAKLTADYNRAQQLLLATPRTVSKEDFQPYKYSVSEIKVVRALKAHCYVVDKSAQRYFKVELDFNEDRSFKVPYRLHDRDLSASAVMARHDKEADIASYEQTPMVLKASQLLDDSLKQQDRAKPLASISALREELRVTKNAALAASKKDQYDAKPVNDQRFESVVVIKTPKGMGSGFFVAPDLVMTNFHVIEGSQYVEMKMYNGTETFGKVVKTDVRLDLALVKVQARGTPVGFFEGNTLELGATVEAIGHPAGLNFTITRGIVSAVRKLPSLLKVGGKDVLFIQTDTAINPGNSGGPLFLNNKVIGINDNYLAAGNGGLSFSIHYSEAKEFLRQAF